MEVHGSQGLIIPNIEVTQRQLIMITKFLHSQYGRLTKNHNTNTQAHTPASAQILLDHAANIRNRCSRTTNTELTAETMTRRSFATNDSHLIGYKPRESSNQYQVVTEMLVALNPNTHRAYRIPKATEYKFVYIKSASRKSNLRRMRIHIL